MKKIYQFAAGWMILLLMWTGIPLSCRAAGVSTYEDAFSGVVRIFVDLGDGWVSSGTGFGIGTAGQPTDIYVTNWHVITSNGEYRPDEVKVYILLSNDAVLIEDDYIGKINYDKMIECDTLYITGGYPDVAILQAKEPVEGHIALPLMHAEDARRGEPVYALGFPASADNMNSGYYYAEIDDISISGSVIGKFLEADPLGATMAIQHHAHINHGNSGGPLVTADGRVIGINTYGWLYEAQEAEEAKNVPSEYSLSIYVDYAMVGLDSLGIAYDVYTPGQSEGNAGPQKGVLIAAAAVIVLLFLAVVVLLIVRRRKKGDSEAARSGEGQSAMLAEREPEERSHSAVKVSGGGSGAVDSGIRLQGTGGNFAGRRFAVNGRIRIGRDPSRNDLVYPQNSQGISGVHCEIHIREGKLYLCDMGSTYGTYLRGKKIPARQEIELHVGDIFCLGSPQESFSIIRKAGA